MKKLHRWFAFSLITVAILCLPRSSVQADVTPVILINEVMSGVNKSIEFYNPSPNPVNIEGYSVLVYHMGGDTLATPYEFPPYTSIEGNGYAVLHLWDGDDPGSNEYYLNNDPAILWNSGGAIEVYDGADVALDFVRFNGSVKAPPAGTGWTGVTPSISDTDNSLGRDNLSTDTDDGSDWIEQAPTLGEQNLAEKCYFLTISKTGSGAIPTAVADHSDGCNAGYYHAEEVVALIGAAPDAGWGIGSWSGSDTDATHASTNTVTMPAAAHSVSVNYLELPAQVTLISPVDQAIQPVGKPIFTWQSVENADRYTFEILRMADNAVIAKVRYTASVRCADGICSIPSPVELEEDDYKWHVAGSNQGLEGTWSLYHRLYMVVPGPQLRSPGDGAIVYGGRPTFKWYEETAAGVEGYRVQLFDSVFTEVGTWTTSAVCGDYCEFRLPFDLESDYGEYTWQVQTIFADADSAWSETRSFVYTQLERTVQISPEDGYTTTVTTPTFEWVEITGATLYLFQVRQLDDTLVGSFLVSDETYCVDGGSCVWELPDALQVGEYKWHVRAKNGRNFGRWTAYRTITIESLPE